MTTAVAEDRPPTLTFPAPHGTDGKKEAPPPPKVDGPSGDTAPKRRGRPPGSTNKGTLSISKIEDSLNEQFTLLGLGVSAFNQYDGRVIMEGSPRLAKAIANLCEKNPKVRKNIERLLTGGSYGEIIIAAGLIAVPIMANHDLMPSGVKNLYGHAIPTPTDSQDEAE